MLTVKRIVDYTIPLFGNKRCLPYGTLLVSDGTEEKRCPIHGDFPQYIIFRRRRYRVRRVGNLYHPLYEIVEE